MALQPQDIASNFTITQIETRIASLMTAIEAAEQSNRDSFSDTQANQSVMRQKLSDLNDSLAIWLRAKAILTGNEDAETELIAANFNPAWPRF